MAAQMQRAIDLPGKTSSNVQELAAMAGVLQRWLVRGLTGGAVK